MQGWRDLDREGRVIVGMSLARICVVAKATQGGNGTRSRGRAAGAATGGEQGRLEGAQLRHHDAAHVARQHAHRALGRGHREGGGGRGGERCVGATISIPEIAAAPEEVIPRYGGDAGRGGGGGLPLASSRLPACALPSSRQPTTSPGFASRPGRPGPSVCLPESPPRCRFPLSLSFPEPSTLSTPPPHLDLRTPHLLSLHIRLQTPSLRPFPSPPNSEAGSTWPARSPTSIPPASRLSRNDSAPPPAGRRLAADLAAPLAPPPQAVGYRGKDRPVPLPLDGVAGAGEEGHLRAAAGVVLSAGCAHCLAPAACRMETCGGVGDGAVSCSNASWRRLQSNPVRCQRHRNQRTRQQSFRIDIAHSELVINDAVMGCKSKKLRNGRMPEN